MSVNIPLKVAILQSGKRQIVIAAKAQINNSKFSQIVQGNVPPTDAEKRAIARVLRRSVSDLWPSPASGEQVA